MRASELGSNSVLLVLSQTSGSDYQYVLTDNSAERVPGSHVLLLNLSGFPIAASTGTDPLVVSGLMPRLAGYVDTTSPPTIEQLERMKTLLITTDFIGVAVALGLLWYYPITRARANETRRLLDERAQSESTVLLDRDDRSVAN